MSQRQGGWRSARHVAPLPQVPRLSATPAAATAAVALPQPPVTERARRTAAAVFEARWSISFVAILAYVAAIVTYRVPFAGPAVIGALIGLVMEKERFVFPPFIALLYLFIGWNAFGLSGSFSPQVTTDQIVVLIKISVIGFAMANVLRNGWRVRTFVVFFLLCYAAYPARGTLINYFLLGYTWFGRALWNYIYSNSNDLATLTFFPLSMCVALLLTEKKGWIRTAALAGAGVLPLIILLTQSRGALIALVFCMILFFSLHSNGKRVRTLLTALALGVVVLPFVPSSAWERFGGLGKAASGNLIEADPEGSAEARYLVWGVARAIIADHAITGVGLGAYGLAHERYAAGMSIPSSAKGNRDTHSTYLNIAAESGLIGLAIFMTMIAVAIGDAELTRRRAKKAPRSQWLLALELGLIAFLVAGIFGSYSKLNSLYVQLAFLWVATNLTKQELAASAPPNVPVAANPRPGPRRRGRLP